jgi:hypothetical protein
MMKLVVGFIIGCVVMVCVNTYDKPYRFNKEAISSMASSATSVLETDKATKSAE